MEKNKEHRAGTFFDEMTIRLKQAGFGTSPADNGCLSVEWREQPLCHVMEGGGVRYRPDDMVNENSEQARDQIIDIAKTTAEYMCQMEDAPQIKATGLSEDYRLLADFNGAVLAGHRTECGVQFVTWLWDYDCTGVTLGHYFGDEYQKAKKDFAIRSGLVLEQRSFTPEQLTVLYLCTEDALNYGLDISDGQDALIRSARSLIEDTVPDLQQRIEAMQEQTQQMPEQTM